MNSSLLTFDDVETDSIEYLEAYSQMTLLIDNFAYELNHNSVGAMLKVLAGYVVEPEDKVAAAVFISLAIEAV